MSSIYKLSICGVRSFDPERSETIQFGFPLTLICGQNGCGKTTIIECLKYATTGDLPPNSKGGAFVHDPKLVYKSEVRAQVKLAFSNANGKSMICTRSMQLSKKRGRGGLEGTATFKTLEGQLAIMNKGERSTISTKNAELDGQIPLYLGASKAVLDYVTFCHQDDSLWPLSEASVLKKRFDDIFEALKFTKVLDNLKVIRKDMTTDIRLIEQSVLHLKIDKERATKVTEKLTKTNLLVEEYMSEIARLTQEIEKVEKQTDKLFKSNQQFQEVLSKLESLKMNQRSYEDQINRLSMSITKLPDSEESLLEQLNNFETVLESKSREIKSLNKKLESTTSTLNVTRQELSLAIRLEGSLKSKEETYQGNLSKRTKLIKTNKKHLSSNNGDYESEEIATEFGNAVNSLLENVKNDHTKLLESNKNTESFALNKLKGVDNQIATHSQKLLHYGQDITEDKQKIEALSKKIELLQYNEGNLEVEKAELESLNSKLSNLREKNEANELQKKVNEGNANLVKLEHEMDEINKNIASSNKQSDIHAKLSLLNETKSQKEKALTKLVQFHDKNFTKEVGENLDTRTCDKMVSSRLTTVNDEIEQLQREFESQRKSFNAISSSEETIKQVLKENIQKEKEYSKKIFEVIDQDQLDTYEKLLVDLEGNYRDSLDALNTIEVTKQFNMKALEIAEKEKHCSLCFRSFEALDLSKFLTLLRERVNKMNLQSLTEDCEQSKEDLKLAKSVNSDVLLYRKLKVEIVELEAKLKTISPEVVTMKEKFDLDLATLNEKKSLLSKLGALQRPMNDILRIQGEIDNCTTSIAEVETMLNDYGDSRMSATELQELQQQKTQEIKLIRQQVDTNTEAKYSKQKDISRMESEVKDKKLAISNLEKSLLDKINLAATVKDLNARVERMSSERQKLEIDLDELKGSKTEFEFELESLQEEHKESEEALNSQVNLLENLGKEFQLYQDSISSFIEKDKPKLLETTKEVVSIEEDITKYESEIQVLETDIKQLERVLNDSSSIQNNIRANLDYRNLQKEYAEVDNQIHELDIANAEGKRNEYQEESKRLRILLSELNADHAGKIGEVRQMEDQIKSLKGELQSEYKGIDKNYHEEWVKLQTNMLVSNDLQTYSKALDNAIMKYHSIKMEDINRIVDELWKLTYKGSDVDTIAIKSDVNLQAKGNRSYNYRVVMYKLGAELDMRGRCSAGQKVLASIIIRLALAECFGVNCGMIALDEPTTNLDIENIESLAEALNNIIDVRKKQKNFQLIVITHDEKFLSHINGDKFTDHFYRVQRDDLQKSTIRSLPINLIQEE